ncbi:hypothetical protein FYM84_16430 [Pseudomonas sp. CAH-1]|nr:hypothetical protein [Pseudomonas sp. CAH-1]
MIARLAARRHMSMGRRFALAVGMGCFPSFDVACTGPFAGAPAPTGSPQALTVWGPPCGSGHARERARAGNGITKAFFVL